MSSRRYKCCAVPLCTNTTIKSPDKLFIFVPFNKTIRNKWLQLARRDIKGILPNTHLYFCEDHFDLPNDMENYMQYHLMGSVSQISMKAGCIPSKFACQPDRRKRTADTIERQYIVKKQRKELIEELLMKTENKTDRESPSGSSVLQENLPEPEVSHLSVSPAAFTATPLWTPESNAPMTTQDAPMTANKCIQVNIIKKIRSKAMQTKINLVHQGTSPLKPLSHSVCTSPLKITSCSTTKPSPSTSYTVQNPYRKLFVVQEESDSDILNTPSVTHIPSSPSITSLQMKSSSDCSDIIKEDREQEASETLEYTLRKIVKNPRFYIGVPKSCYFLIELIKEETNISAVHILMCLKKIRLNNAFRELADDFGINATYASKIFQKNIPVIASVMRPFIVNLDKDSIRKNLPMAFRRKYHKVSCIIDCFEIEVQKPSNAVNQSLSWSEYKKGNTIKYLVSCTPNGLVNYISPGFGGRITDTTLVETCDFIKGLEPGMSVMADRGFKHVEQYLRKHGVQLVRPPSVQTGVKLSKQEARETKQVASLRIHVERLIRRFREFSLLKSHACVNLNLVKVLDDIITIACGLVNLQDSLIK